LLASAFPNLTGAQIVDILFRSADDAGAAGRDGVFGNGILNIARAFSPLGQTGLAGSAAPVSTTSNGQSSGPMGDATAKTIGAVILDGYSRAYALDIAQTLTRAPREQPLAQALNANMRTGASATKALAVTLTVSRRDTSRPVVRLTPTGLSFEDSREAKAIAGMALTRLDPKTAIAFGFAESGRTLQQRLTGHEGNAFLIARDPAARSGFLTEAGTSVGVRRMIGRTGLTVTAERGEVWNPGLAPSFGEAGYSIGALTLDRKLGPASLSLGVSRLAEDETVLGGRFSAAFSGRGASSLFADAGAALDFGRGWGAYASYRRGWTSLPGTGALVERGRLATQAFAFDVSRRGVFKKGDSLALRVTQPLRVGSGGFDLNIPVSYDYATGDVGYRRDFFNLAPTGREMDFEAAYTMRLLGGGFGANLFLRKEPGHIETGADDVGGAIRFTLGF